MNKDEMLKIVNDNISRLEKNEFNVYFFVIDTKGNPSSQLEYIYRSAYTLKNLGYNVSMLHNDNDFVGVGDWLGEEYAEMQHYNIEKENVQISSSDFLFVPEILINVLAQTKKLSCKRVIIIQNYNYLNEFMPVSQNMYTLGITDAIITTEQQEKKIKSYFPEIRTHIVHPSINKIFHKSDDIQKLLVNIVSKNQSLVHQILKPFYWVYDMYKWVSFRDLRSVTQEVFAESLREAAITIWCDDDTNFGYSLLEALRSGGVVLAKVPEHPADWMLDENGELTNSILWFNDIDDVPKMIATVIRSWTNDSIPKDIYTKQDSFSNMFSEEEQEKEIKEIYSSIFVKRLTEFKEVKVDVENNVFNTKE